MRAAQVVLDILVALGYSADDVMAMSMGEAMSLLEVEASWRAS